MQRALRMKEHKNMKPKEREYVSRLVGIPTPVAGKDWNPPADEQDKARQVLAHIAEQQVLWDRNDKAIISFIVQSVLDIRERVSHDIKNVPPDSILYQGLQAMDMAGRKFLEENQSPRSGYGPPYEAQLHSTLGELRALFGVHITRIACAYDLEIDTCLDGLLPPAPK